MWGTYSRLNVHVMSSNMHVIRIARTRLKKKVRTGRATRQQRHWFYREMLRYHADERSLYLDVMSGRIG